MYLDDLRDARRALQQWELDRRLGYFYDRPRPRGGGAGGGTDPGGVAWSLTTIQDGKIFQRDVANPYAATITIAGTYAGIVSTVEARISEPLYDSTIVDWVTLDDSLNGGNFLGTILVPTGGPYRVQVRDAANTLEGVTGATQFFVGAVVIGYGQSNWLGHMGTTLSPPPAQSRTRYFDGSIWTTPPLGNGIRAFLNFMADDTNMPWGIVSGGVSGVDIAVLMEGDASGQFDILASRIAGSGGKAEAILWHQGEGDANIASPTSKAVYQSRLSTLHQSIVDEVGRSKAECPLICSSMATVSDSSFVQSDLAWHTINDALMTVNAANPNMYYSHTNMDATLTDGVHYTATHYERSGRRYAQTLLRILGHETVGAAWFVTGATIVNATETDVTVAPLLGTDMFPSSGLMTGFEISGDNGANWAIPYLAVRQNSPNTIRLLHSQFDTTIDRLVRYHWGKLPDISIPVVDDSALQLPLNFTPVDNVTAEGSGANPLPNFQGTVSNGGSAQVQVLTYTQVGPFAEDRLIVLGAAHPNGGISFTSMIINASGGNITATQDHVTTETAEDDRRLEFWKGVLPAGQTFTTVTVTHSVNPFAGTCLACWSIKDLLSTTKVSSIGAGAINATVVTADFNTSAGGVVLTIGMLRDFNGNNCVISGDEAYTERTDATLSGIRFVAGDATNTAAVSDNTNTVTYTWTTPFDIALAAISYR